MRHARTRPLALLLLPLFVVACQGDVPTAPTLKPEAVSLSEAGNGATTEREDWGPFPVTIRPPAPCLGDGVRLVITGSISGWDLITSTPTGKTHIAERIDMTQLSATHGGHTWTAAPGSHEIWSFMIAPGGMANRIHVGNTMFTSETTDLKLKFVHRIHVQIHPDGSREILRNIFEVQCVGAE